MRQTTIIFLLFISTAGFAQNLFGDFTSADFIKRNSTQLKFVTTRVDTLTGKQETQSAIVAFYDPKTKIITINDSETRQKWYFMTDSSNELYSVSADGKEDTISFPKCKTEIINDSVAKNCDILKFYNKKRQLIKTITDTNSKSALTLTETIYSYSGDTLKHYISKHFTFHPSSTINKYTPNEPEDIIEAFINGNQEIITRKNLKRPSNIISTSKTITENNLKTIISKTYCNNRLTFISTYIFE